MNLFIAFVLALGLPRDLAYRLASQTVLGSGQLVRDSGVHPGKLKDDVTSPAGKFFFLLNAYKLDTGPLPFVCFSFHGFFVCVVAT